jgi:glycosyltransferase involved in cell wall biosynthesis
MQRFEISILLPVYNGAEYLYECIEAVLRQDCPNFELIIGDDCSTDDSAAIIKRFDDPRIRYIRNERTLGLFGNLNNLLGETKAPLVRLLGQDDILEPNCLRETVSFFQDHERIGMGFSCIVNIDEQGVQIYRHPQNVFPDIIESDLALQLFLYYGNIPGNITNVCFRKAVIDELGGFSEVHGNPGDYEMWVRIAENYPIGVIQKHLVLVRRHTQQLSRVRSSPFNVVEAEEVIRDRLIRHLPKHRQRRAWLYVRMRQGVMQVHMAVYWLITGDGAYFFETIKRVGVGNFSISAFFWLITWNNRLYQPKVVVHIHDRSVQLGLPRSHIVYLDKSG